MKVVFDANVLLSGLLTRGVCESLLDACLSSPNHTTVLSEHILREFARNAVGKFGVPEAEVGQIVEFLKSQVEVVEPAEVPPDACRDAADLAVLGTALAAGAACVVTGDAVLLALGTFRGIPILSPRAFYDRLR